MARIFKDGKINGILGDFRIYELNGQTIIGKKGGPPIKMLKTSKKYEVLRLKRAEFSMAGKISGFIKRGCPELNKLWTSKNFALLQSKLNQLYTLDSVSGLGQRNFYFSKNKELFPVLDITELSYHNYLFPIPTISIDSNDKTSLNIEFAEEFKVLFPKGFHEARIRFFFQRIYDVVFDQSTKSYQELPHNTFNTIIRSEILECTWKQELGSKSLSFDLLEELKDNEALLCYVHIEFLRTRTVDKKAMVYAGLIADVTNVNS